MGVKCCDVSKTNTNAHEYFAMASVNHQMCAELPDEAVIFSCDSKVKIHIGGQAVSRYHQIRTFFRRMMYHTIATMISLSLDI